MATLENLMDHLVKTAYLPAVDDNDVISICGCEVRRLTGE